MADGGAVLFVCKAHTRRTWLENEVDSVTCRLDLLAKMMDIDPNEPTAEERQRGVTKLRYMKVLKCLWESVV